jgi:putative ABC transport system permease protein
VNRPVAYDAKAIIAKDQVSLSLGRCFHLAVSGMSHRLFRSVVTTAVLALAAAFLVHILGYSLLEQRTHDKAFAIAQNYRRLGHELSRLSQVDGSGIILSALSSRDPGLVREYAGFAEDTPATIELARRTAHRLTRATEYVQSLAPASRAILLGDLSPDELLLRLENPTEFAEFERRLAQLTLRPPLGSVEEFRSLVSRDLPWLHALVGRIRDGHARAIERLESALRARGTTLDEAFTKHAHSVIVEAAGKAGFGLTSSRVAELQKAHERQSDRREIERWLLEPRVAQAVARSLGVELSLINFERVAAFAGTGRGLEEVLALRERVKGLEHLPPQRIARAISVHVTEKRLGQVAQGKTSGDLGWFGLSSRNQWLAILSFLVCMVGVANAMLMSVTERFTEIATMKCLGALDRFVMLMFVIEALVQGAVGGVIGLLIGVALALIRGLVEFGSLVSMASDAAGSIAISMLFALGCTMVLSALSAVGPAYVAARLSPMEAMRVE